MSQSRASSPRMEALAAISEVRAARSHTKIDLMTWDKIVTIAWDGRAQSRDRHEVQSDLRQVLLEASVNGSPDDAAS